MKEILINSGWTFSGMCKTCSGAGENYLNAAYPGYMVKVFNKHSFFLLLLNQRQVKRGNAESIQEVISDPTAFQRG